jgi:hypothetical protein
LTRPIHRHPEAASDALLAFRDDFEVLHGFRKPMLGGQEGRALSDPRGRALGRGLR